MTCICSKGGWNPECEDHPRQPTDNFGSTRIPSPTDDDNTPDEETE